MVDKIFENKEKIIPDCGKSFYRTQSAGYGISGVRNNVGGNFVELYMRSLGDGLRIVVGVQANPASYKEKVISHYGWNDMQKHLDNGELTPEYYQSIITGMRHPTCGA